MSILSRIVIPVFVSLVAIAALADDPPTPPQEPLPKPELTKVVQTDKGEMLLADSFSRTLYVFDLDKDKPNPVCNGNCAELWPPYILTEDEVAELQPPLGSIERTSKKIQLTYEGRPVYTYGFDREQGDDMGNGIGDVWHHIEVQTPQPPTP
ncbi:COG4315 family predicted lipoprotein [Bdellovibrio svalbardensis]|uniref:Lipoprotein n=1 Tax=Bdellovibrio svalbardensis TaxID=2972972 RepID=A0ABT6DK02_9BACT|nr:hypothetical protein [Bdellovibrio svalbardensis]MDG0816981.1 hypothetical protein [Bdellovibrio svalbardensis]